MLKKKKAQGMSIKIIIVAVIGLIILVVVMGIFTGRIGTYTSGVEGWTTCESTCKNIGADRHNSLLKSNCVDTPTSKKNILPGTFSDITLSQNVCCCIYGK